MEETWNEVLRDLSVPEDIATKWWSQIMVQYTESARIYHTMDNYLRKKFEIYDIMVKDNISERSAFVLAMFFQHYEHDTNVYGDSIDKNVEHVKNFFKDAGINHEGLISTVVGLLGAACESGSSKEGIDAYFQDLELAALGASPDEYVEYITDIEKEYSNMPAHFYRSLRLKVLQTLLLIPKIYSTDLFYEKYETQARENIEKEINEVLK
ncbi:uncharacterized protein LOC143912952 [Arctopsyche grandis]|uniref:uncharacterized protein LOC143912952 n=1 Tax=Arctopsyche grandis TaxID=121162 RepID=UPI00406D931C